ncbi:NACHT, LRR and PYD domains-containing protein 12-like [Engraulis encrasicolus]|uniref:NACHT, LRR and PYD domains-containing protein 12-like n=1 Tax=Engraulis encrasicolus TaxID=184585 RepID=UPI002FD6877B
MSSPGKQESQLGEEPEAHRVSRKVTGSGVSRAPSMRSDVSKDDGPNMAGGERLSRKGPGSGVSRAPSMRSDWSKDDGPKMAGGERHSRKETGSGVSRAQSMRTDWSKEEPPYMAKGEREQEIEYDLDTSSSQDKQSDLLHIFKELEENIITFLKKELQRFRMILCPDYQENYDMKAGDESDAREGALKMALHFLRKMEHQDLADKLNESKIDELNIICQNDLKRTLKNRYQNVSEGIAKSGSSVLLQNIFTELYITEGGSGKVIEEHEVRQIESMSKRAAGQDKQIKCSDIFKPSTSQDKPIRRVLTKGVAGIGKTISVNKYILDWAEGHDNKDIDFIFPLCFRELNLMKDKEWSLMDLLHHFFPETKQLTIGCQKKYNMLFVLDGLDECRLHLNFQTNENVSDVRAVTSLDVLLKNLIKGNLFPSALLWITSRPAAASQIPPECVDLVTEAQGFNDSQKQEYFKKKINEEQLARRIISHIQSTRSLHIMCHIPVFCWIAAMVLQTIYSSGHTQIPKTLTEMYTYFLMFQTRQRNNKFDNVHDLNTQQNHKLILHLGKLAYDQLEKGNLIFYEEDLRECGIDDKDATVFSGLCTRIIQEESGIIQRPMFCFVHLTVQEYLAALYAMMMLGIEKKDIISSPHSPPVMKSIITLQKSAVDKALAYEDGRFDLFLRFLLGLSVESTQTLLHGLIQTRQIKMGNNETITYIKEKIREASSCERMINLFHCLNELNDNSLVEEIRSFLSAGSLSEAQLSPGQWSALVFMLLTSDQNLNVFDLKKYARSDEALLRMKPVLEESYTILVARCGLTKQSCATLATILCKDSSKLRHLDLSDNHIGDDGLQLLCSGLEIPTSALETLRADGCGLSEQSCTTIASILCKDSSKLRHLDLSDNHIGDVGVQLLVDSCKLTKQSCATLATILCKDSSKLRHLDLSDNRIGDVGVNQLCSGLESPDCALEILRLSDCGVTGGGYAALAAALKSNPSHLEELDLRGNDPGDPRVKLLTDLLQDPHCFLSLLRLLCPSKEEACEYLTTVLGGNPLLMTELDLSGQILGDSGAKQFCALLEDSHCRVKTLTANSCGLTAQRCTRLASILSKESSKLRYLDLSGNHIGDVGVQLLCSGLKNHNCALETLSLSDCGVTGEGYAALASALKSNPSHLEELDLRGNDPGDSRVKLLTDLLQDPQCKLKRLRLLKTGSAEEACEYLTTVLGGNPLLLTELDLSGKIPGHSGAKQFCALLEDSHCRAKTITVDSCGLTAQSCTTLANILCKESSKLRHLDLSDNHIGDVGVQLLFSGLRSPKCVLEALK